MGSKIRRLDLRDPSLVAAEQSANQAWSAYMARRRIIHVAFETDTRSLRSALKRASDQAQPLRLALLR